MCEQTQQGTQRRGLQPLPVCQSTYLVHGRFHRSSSWLWSGSHDYGRWAIGGLEDRSETNNLLELSRSSAWSRWKGFVSILPYEHLISRAFGEDELYIYLQPPCEDWLSGGQKSRFYKKSVLMSRWIPKEADREIVELKGVINGTPRGWCQNTEDRSDCILAVMRKPFTVGGVSLLNISLCNTQTSFMIALKAQTVRWRIHLILLDRCKTVVRVIDVDHRCESSMRAAGKPLWLATVLPTSKLGVLIFKDSRSW